MLTAIHWPKDETPLTARYSQARAEYIRLRTEEERLSALADAAFNRWFSGEVQSAQAATRAANRTNYASAETAGAEIKLYAAADAVGIQNLDLDKIWEER